MLAFVILIGLILIYWPREPGFDLSPVGSPTSQFTELGLSYKEAIDAKT